MLSTLLEKLGTLLPKNFIIANLFPMLLFAAMNGLMLYWMSDGFRQAVQKYFAMSAGSQALIGFPILIAVALAAYIFSTLNLFQREFLEGRCLTSGLQKVLTAGQQRRVDRAANKFFQITEDRRAFKRLNGVKNLRAARESGNQTNEECVYSEDSDAAIAVVALEEKRLRYDFIRAEEF